jgi:transcriptional regulator with XRE-family HTH domain
MPKIGDELRAAREARHLSLSEVSEQLHIRSVYLEALEDEQWALIGAPVYVRGFLRTYARYLGLEPEPAVAEYNETLERTPAAVPERRRYSRRAVRRGNASPWLWLAALAAAILVGFVGYNYFELRSSHHTLALAGPLASETAAPGPATSPDVAAAPRAGDRGLGPTARRTLEVRLTSTTWLLVEIDGSKRLEGTFPPGTRKAFHGTFADIRTGNAGGVELTVNGKELGAMGHSGGVVERRLPLDEE